MTHAYWSIIVVAIFLGLSVVGLIYEHRHVGHALQAGDKGWDVDLERRQERVREIEHRLGLLDKEKDDD